MNITKPDKTSGIDPVATAACAAMVICWAIGPVMIKYLTGYADSWTQNALRYSTAALFWLPYLLYSMKKRTIERNLWRNTLAPSAVNVVMQSLWTVGFYYTGATFMTLLSKTSTFWIAILSFILFAEERIILKNRQFRLGFLLAVIGLIGVIYFKKDFSAQGTITGIMFILSASFMWGVYTVTVKISCKNIDPRRAFAVTSIYTTAGLWLLAGLFGKPSSALTFGPEQWAGVVLSSVTAIALAHVFYYTAVKRIGAIIPGVAILAQPFGVFLLSWIFFKETLTLLQVIFGIALLTGAALAILAQKKAKQQY